MCNGAIRIKAKTKSQVLSNNEQKPLFAGVFYFIRFSSFAP